MDSFLDAAKRVLDGYTDIYNVSGFEAGGLTFELLGCKYAILELNPNSFPVVFAIDSIDNYPHLMFYELPIGREKWRALCLYDKGTLVEYIHTNEEKVRICIDRLHSLVTLSESQIEKEYHKEFLVYWNQYGRSKKGKTKKYQLYLNDSEEWQWLEQHHYEDAIRLTSADRFFNDESKKQYVDKTPALYLPLRDIQGLLPPLKNEPWNAETINDIICGLQHQRIDTEAFNIIAETSYSKKEILFVFQIHNMYFGCLVVFQNPGTAKLMVKIESQISEVFSVNVSRCDITFLNQQIGNIVHKEPIVVVGAGSLGSYVIDELAHAGYQDITVIDDDSFEYANVFRHRGSVFGSTLAKSNIMGIRTNWLHPEMKVTAIDDNLTPNNVDKYIPDSVNTVIFTVGNSDTQLQMNALLSNRSHHIRVYYAWLEHDGKSSHVAAIRTREEGCFECLYTDKIGNLCNNTANQADPSSLIYTRDGCGGTRISYGNSTLLTATALVLEALKDDDPHNAIYSFVNGSIIKQTFPQNTRCTCCGVR